MGLLFGSELHTEGRTSTALSGEASFTAFLLLLSKGPIRLRGGLTFV